MRQAIRNWLGIDERIRDLLARELAARVSPQAAEIEELRTQIAALEKKLKMTMGSVQASGMQVMGLSNEIQQANQVATTARTTAESVADGLEVLEAKVDRLMETIPA